MTKSPISNSSTQLKIVYWLFAAVVVAYCWLTFTAPVDTEAIEKYDISATQLKLILATIVVPLLLIWASAVYGYTSFKRYALIIKKSKDGQAVLQIANGIGLIALQLVAISFFSALMAAQGENRLISARSTALLTGFATLIVSLFAYYLIMEGSRKLKSLVDNKSSLFKTWQLAAFVAVALIYIALLVQYKLGPASSNNEAIVNILSLPLLLITYALPYLLVWYFGFSGALALRQYQKRVQGIIYKQIFGGLATGIYIVIGMSVISQLLSTFSSQLEGASLGPLLALIYLLIGLIAVGFLFVARSASKLRTLEEV